MKQLYPHVILPALTKLAILALLLTGSATAFSQSLNFNTPVLESGTNQMAGSVYRFKAVTASGNIDALVSVDSLIGVSLYSLDATPSGSSATAFQPQLSSLGGIGYHYAVFTVNFVTAGTSDPTQIFDFSSVFMGLDGSNQITEFNAITIANAGGQYVSSTPKVSVTQDGNTYTATATSSNPTGGQDIDENDSTQMFKVSASVTNHFTVRVGYYQQQNGWNGNNLFSLNIRGAQIQNSVLSVNLLSFSTSLVNDKVLIMWSTGKEENFSHFIIERSYDKNNYEQAALIFSAEVPDAVNNYSYKDAIKNTTAPVIYYRLKMVDKNGNFKYSDVRTVHLEQEGELSKIATYPNPVVNNLHIAIPLNWRNKTVNCQLLNVSGQVIKSFTIQQAGQTASFSMTQVPNGTYYIKAFSGREISVQPIIKSANN